MKTTVYEDYKYVMADTSSIYLGAGYSYEELMQREEVPFKFQAIVEHYFLKDTAPETTLESQLYYLEKDSFSYKTFHQLKARIKVCELTKKKHLFGKETNEYCQKIYSIEELVAFNLAQKKGRGMVIQEVILSKLAMTFFGV